MGMPYEDHEAEIANRAKQRARRKPGAKPYQREKRPRPHPGTPRHQQPATREGGGQEGSEPAKGTNILCAPLLTLERSTAREYLSSRQQRSFSSSGIRNRA